MQISKVIKRICIQFKQYVINNDYGPEMYITYER